MPPPLPEATPSLPQAEPPLSTQKQVAAPSKAVVALLAKADNARHSGQLELAAANLERAVRIAPKDPLPWQRLAQLRLEQGDARQAETLANKSNSLAAGSHGIIRRNWQIIAEARRLEGDTQGALRAERKLRELDL